MTIERRRRTRQERAGQLPTAAVAAVLLGLATGHQALADQRCARGADVRLIEIRFADEAGSLPCKVIYRPETESDTLGIVSWQNLASLAACEARSREVTGRLTGEGWTCSRAVAASTGSRTVLPAAARETPDAAGGAAEAAPSDRDSTALAALPPGPDAAAPDELDEPARLLDNPAIAAPPETLAALVRADLQELDITLDGQLAAEIAAYGDLNGDAIDDALVLYTYTSPQPAYRQFLAVYMFDGDAYQLTATRPVGGTVSGTMDARIEAIDRGVIHLRLQAFLPGDTSCCPSGTRRLALALRDLDLVDVNANAPGR